MKTHSYPVFHALHETDLSLSTTEHLALSPKPSFLELLVQVIGQEYLLVNPNKYSVKWPFSAKRIFDLFFTLLALTLLFPVLLIISLIIKLESKGSVFYIPLREGKNNALFPCLKFRTMHAHQCDNPVSGNRSTVINDPRITRFGRFLRKYSLDELPQLFNVLRGEMSLVGPRPHRTQLGQEFRAHDLNYDLRHKVKPGLTGWAQVNGWRGSTKTLQQKIERIKHDLWYVSNRNLFLDLKIIWLTVFGGGLKDPLCP
ncbi:MAG: sugar transferase [Saprospiraceae bacterium]|nr:sugar transferase [Saprospiraceae bacterium]